MNDIENLAAEMDRWADEDVPDVGRDVLRRKAQEFARRVRRLAFQVPEVAVVRPDGKRSYTGFYFEMPSRQDYPISDGKSEDVPTTRCIVHYLPGDWGLSNSPKLAEVTPPHRFVPTGRFVSLLDPPEGPDVSGGGKSK